MTGIGPCGITSAGTQTAQRFLLRTSFQVGTQPPKVTVQHPARLWVGWERVLRHVWEKGGADREGERERERWRGHVQLGPALPILSGLCHHTGNAGEAS